MRSECWRSPTEERFKNADISPTVSKRTSSHRQAHLQEHEQRPLEHVLKPSSYVKHGMHRISSEKTCRSSVLSMLPAVQQQHPASHNHQWMMLRQLQSGFPSSCTCSLAALIPSFDSPVYSFFGSSSSPPPINAMRLAVIRSCRRSRAALVLARLASISSFRTRSRCFSALALWI